MNDQRLDPERLARIGRGVRDNDHADTTRRDLGYAWRGFEAWCEEHDERPLPAPPRALAAYLAERAEQVTLQSLRRVMRAVRDAHEEAGLDSPTEVEFVQDVWAGLLALGRGEAPGEERREVVRLDEVLADELREMVAALPESVQGKRDKLLLLTGAAGSLSRAELVGLKVEDVRFDEGGLELRVHHRGAGRFIVVQDTDDELSLRTAMQAWLDESGIRSGFLFRGITRSGQVREGPLSTQAVHVILRRAAKRARLPDEIASTELFAKSHHG